MNHKKKKENFMYIPRSFPIVKELFLLCFLFTELPRCYSGYHKQLLILMSWVRFTGRTAASSSILRAAAVNLSVSIVMNISNNRY